MSPESLGTIPKDACLSPLRQKKTPGSSFMASVRCGSKTGGRETALNKEEEKSVMYPNAAHVQEKVPPKNTKQ